MHIYIITQLAVYTTYIPLIYCQLGEYISIPPIKGTRKLHWNHKSLKLTPSGNLFLQRFSFLMTKSSISGLACLLHRSVKKTPNVLGKLNKWKPESGFSGVRFEIFPRKTYSRGWTIFKHVLCFWLGNWSVFLFKWPPRMVDQVGSRIESPGDRYSPTWRWFFKGPTKIPRDKQFIVIYCWTLLFHNLTPSLLLMEEILHQLIWIIPVFKGFDTSQVVRDFFHQQ